MNLKDKVALVTGAGSGIGKAAALLFAEAGARVAVLSDTLAEAEKIPLSNKPGSAGQVAQLALFLASDASSHITGTPVWIDGAQSLLA